MSLKISRILHAGYVFEYGEVKVAFDPIFENPFSVNCYAYPEVNFDGEQIKNLKFDAVFISHYHDDHCSFESLNLLDRNTPIYMYCVFDEMFLLLKQLGFVYIYPLSLGETIQIKELKIKPLRALDADVDVMFHIQAGELNVLNVVDSWIDQAMILQLAVIVWDLILWPFQTMREIEVLSPSRTKPSDVRMPIEWREQLKMLKPLYLVPSSCQFRFEAWSWLNHAFFPISYQEFHDEIEMLLPDTQVMRLNPGVSIILNRGQCSLAEPLSWLTPVGEQDVDYDYRPGFSVPTTAEIAQRLDALTVQQIKRVFEFCDRELLEKYQSLGPSEEIYFNQPRLWRLSLYDYQGNSTHYYYRLIGDQIEIVLNSDEPLAWTTEIPIVKLHSALENGESLSSLYIRINNRSFSEEIEKELVSVELMEDPLLRCLYNNQFAAYQKAQLKRIKNLEYSSEQAQNIKNVVTV